MGNFIEEFYYGNLDPQARSTMQNKTVQKQMEVLMLNEDYLAENLSGESKKRFLEFVNAWGVVNGESNLDTLYDYLLQIDRDAEEMFSELVKRMAIQEGVSEQLKADNQIEWVGKMNNTRQRATEIINHDIIYN